MCRGKCKQVRPVKKPLKHDDGLCSGPQEGFENQGGVMRPFNGTGLAPEFVKTWVVEVIAPSPSQIPMALMFPSDFYRTTTLARSLLSCKMNPLAQIYTNRTEPCLKVRRDRFPSIMSSILHCKCFDHKNYGVWKLRSPCRENLHYLWKRAVRIAGKYNQNCTCCSTARLTFQFKQ